MSSLFIGISAIALYLLVGTLLLRRLVSGVSEPSPAQRAGVLILGTTALVLHALALYPLMLTSEGINLGFFNAASLVGLLMCLQLVVASLQKPVENIGIIVMPVAAVGLALAYAFPTTHLLDAGGGWRLQLHVILSVLAYSLLAIGALQALILAFQDHQLKHRRPGGLVRALPPLQDMETLLFQMIGTGFVLLSAALLTGVLFLQDIFAQHLVHKTVLSIVAWLVFATLLWGRLRFGWRGATAIRWTLGGFVVLMLAYFGSKLVLELILARPDSIVTIP